MEKKDVLEDIQQSWIHSHEEDTDTEMVFRPADYNFPLSRGRSGFELSSDNKLNEINIAPTDKLEDRPGSWELRSDDDDLTLELNPDTSAVRNLKITSVSKDRLVLKK